MSHALQCTTADSECSSNASKLSFSLRTMASLLHYASGAMLVPVRFILVDARCRHHANYEAYELAMAHVRTALREFADLRALSVHTIDDQLLCSITAVGAAGLIMILKPQKFHLQALHLAAEKLQLHLSTTSTNVGTLRTQSEDVALIAALEAISELNANLKRSITDAVLQTKIAYLTTEIPAPATALGRTLSLLCDQGAAVDFIQLISPLATTVSLETGARTNTANPSRIAEFAFFLREWFNCSLKHAEASEKGLSRMMKEWIIELLPRQHASLKLPNGQLIPCTLHRELLPEPELASVKVCRCHVALPTPAESLCSVSKQPLIAAGGHTDALQLGRALIGTCSFSGDTDAASDEVTTRLVVIKRVPLAAVSEGAVYGTPLVLGATLDVRQEWEDMRTAQLLFVGLIDNLVARTEGLIVTAEVHSTALLKRYFLLIPENEQHTLLVKQLACCEQLLPLVDVSPCNMADTALEAARRETAQALDSIEVDAHFDPLCYLSGLHAATARIVRESVAEYVAQKKRQTREVAATTAPAAARNTVPPSQTPKRMAVPPRKSGVQTQPPTSMPARARKDLKIAKILDL